MDLIELLANVKQEREFSFNNKTNKIEDNLKELLEAAKGDYYYIGLFMFLQKKIQR